MKVVFAGPSIYGLDIDWTGLAQRSPAAFGDVVRAVRDGARSIGLIDGYFGWTRSVWHKEILYALDQGVAVFGASSLGALRSAECQDYGMIPIGQIAAWYCEGILEDDGDVALLHYPEEAGFAPFSEALVDTRATLDHLRELDLIDLREYAALWDSAHSLNFRDRTIEVLVRSALGTSRAEVVQQSYLANRVSLKGRDAMALIAVMREIDSPAVWPAWEFTSSFTWESAFPQQ